MRWSLISSISLTLLTFGATVTTVTALPAPRPDSSSELEARAAVRPKDVKTSTYRKNAAQSPVVYQNSGGKLTKYAGNGQVQKGKEADHVVEAQTYAKGINAAPKPPTPAAMAAGKKLFNSGGPSGNVVFVDKPTNGRKGGDTRKALASKPTSGDKGVKAYVGANKANSLSMARRLDQTMAKNGTPGTKVEKTQRDVLRRMGIKRRSLALDNFLDDLD
jgi:hypothetical protein